MPLALSYVWDAWKRLRRRSSAGVNGADPITWQDIDAFVRRTGSRLDPRDIELIEDLDDLYLASLTSEADEGSQRQALKDGLLSVSKGHKTA